MRITILLILMLPLFCQSQGLYLSLANGIGQHKEELIQPLVYEGYRLGIGVDYSYERSPDNLLFVDFMVAGTVTAKSRLGNDMSQLDVSLELGSLFSTKHPFWKTGVSVQAHYDYALYSLNYEYPFWFTQYTLNWSNQLQIPLGESSRLNLLVSVPLAGIFSRVNNEVLYDTKEDYTKAYFHQDMSFGSWNDFQAITTSVFYHWKQKKNGRYRIGYRGKYYSYRLPRTISRVYHSLVLSLKLNSKNEQ